MEDDTNYDSFVREVQRELKDLSKQLESAFPKDEGGDVDYASHKLFHKKQQDRETELEISRSKIFRDVISWLTIGALSIIASALVNTYLIHGTLLIK